ncbi:MAG: hypothetical protein IPJ77_09710 [Planctomycetes bacterium]|nr:hypothetical protein [Planctomycetota bacterium]
MPGCLETTMDEFLRLRLGAEPIDNLPMTTEQRQGRKADYFLDERRIVIEVKLLTDSRIDSVRETMDSWRREPDWPLFRGELSVAEIAAMHPRGPELHRALFVAASKVIGRCARNANEQIGETVRVFRLGAPQGVLLLLNESVDILEPGMLGTAAMNAIRAMKADGTRELAHLDGVIIISWAHEVRSPNGELASPVIWIASEDLTAGEREGAFETYFIREWSDFLRLPLHDGGLIESPDQVNAIGAHTPRPPIVLDGDRLPLT